MIKKLTCFILTVLMCFALCISSFAYYGEALPRVIDDADLLAGTEEMHLLAKFDEIADIAEFDVIIATVNTLDGKSPQEYADDLYDYNDFGLGDKKDGILLLVSMEDRDVYISTTGLGIDIFGDGVWDDSILNRIIPYLSDGRYYDAFMLYASLCEMHIMPDEAEGIPDKYEDGYNGIDEYYYNDNFNDNYYYDSDSGTYVPHSKGFGSDIITMIPVAIVIGMVISLLIMIGFRSQLKSVRRKPTAHDYQVPGSMQVTHQSDMYLYSHVTRTPKQTQSNNHSRGGGFSGGGVHVGSSGRSHGGGGGKF